MSGTGLTSHCGENGVHRDSTGASCKNLLPDGVASLSAAGTVQQPLPPCHLEDVPPANMERLLPHMYSGAQAICAAFGANDADLLQNLQHGGRQLDARGFAAATVVCALGFLALRIVLGILLAPFLTNWTPRKAREIHDRMISTIHAPCSACLAIIAVGESGFRLQDLSSDADLWLGFGPWQLRAMLFTAGYTLFDCVHVVYVEVPKHPVAWSIIVHHLVIIATYGMVRSLHHPFVRLPRASPA